MVFISSITSSSDIMFPLLVDCALTTYEICYETLIKDTILHLHSPSSSKILLPLLDPLNFFSCLASFHSFVTVEPMLILASSIFFILSLLSFSITGNLNKRAERRNDENVPAVSVSASNIWANGCRVLTSDDLPVDSESKS